MFSSNKSFHKFPGGFICKFSNHFKQYLKYSILFLLIFFCLAVHASNPELSTHNSIAIISAISPEENITHRADFLEHEVDGVLNVFDVKSSGNTLVHFTIATLLVAIGMLLRKYLTTIAFNQLKTLASRTETTLDDKLFPVLEEPVATFILLIAIFSALRVLKLSAAIDTAIGYGSTVAFSTVFFWGLLRAFSALLDHVHEIAMKRNHSIAAFMPWIKKAIIFIFVVFSALITAQNLGADVKAFLAGLGIGALAFAIAAQDTIANLFGSIVVATDQPFKVGDMVKIGVHEGMVEEIGLRSTKLRSVGQNLIVIPNKMVAMEPIINNSRFAGRRVEQVLGIAYAIKATQMEDIVSEIRRILMAEIEVDQASIHVYFRDYGVLSLEIWLAYKVKDSDFIKYMTLRQRANIMIMQAMQMRNLEFALVKH